MNILAMTDSKSGKKILWNYPSLS